jgi:hypothetical protein
MKQAIGQRVVRGPNWEWSDQDGGVGNEGICIEGGRGGWTKVKWDKGGTSSCKNGIDGAYDLAPAPSLTAAKQVVVSTPFCDTFSNCSLL